LDYWGFIPDKDRNFSPLNHVRTIYGAHPASYPMGIGISFPGGKVAKAWSWRPTYIWCCWG